MARNTYSIYQPFLNNIKAIIILLSKGPLFLRKVKEFKYYLSYLQIKLQNKHNTS